MLTFRLDGYSKGNVVQSAGLINRCLQHLHNAGRSMPSANGSSWRNKTKQQYDQLERHLMRGKLNFNYNSHAHTHTRTNARTHAHTHAHTHERTRIQHTNCRSSLLFTSLFFCYYFYFKAICRGVQQRSPDPMLHCMSVPVNPFFARGKR